jgi:hypothetical protein
VDDKGWERLRLWSNDQPHMPYEELSRDTTLMSGFGILPTILSLEDHCCLGMSVGA